MNEITVHKDELLGKLRQNRTDHRAIFDEAMEGFQRRVEAELGQLLEDVRAGRRRDIRAVWYVPKDHTGDYDRAVAMVEMSIGDTVTLSERDFAQYVMDDWGWQGEFLSNTYGSRTAVGKFSDSYVVE